MIKSHDALDKVLGEDTNHPDLLVCHGTALSLVHAIAAKGSHETILLIVDHRFVQVLQQTMVSAINGRGWVLNLTEDCGENGDVVLEVLMQLVEVSDTTSGSLDQLSVCLNWVLLSSVLLFVTAVQEE